MPQTRAFCIAKDLGRSEEDPTFGFEMDTDELHKRVYISNAAQKSSASSIYKTKNWFWNNLKGAFLTHVNDVPVFSKCDAVKQLKLLKDRGVKEFSITFAPERPITKRNFVMLLMIIIISSLVLQRRSSQNT